MKKTLKRMLTAVVLLVSSVITFAQAPVGEGWTSTEVADGVVYYTFSGMDEISGAAQQVFVIDLDLNNPRYAFRFAYSEKQVTTSDVFLRNHAVAAMNAAYEPSSVVIKVNGDFYSVMPYNTVFEEPVPNWKSEAAVYTDGFRDVKISFDGKGKSIEEQRTFYSSCTGLNILSSAPMLIDDYDPVGERFVDPSLTMEDIQQLHYEDPSRHQGVRHPRSAVAKTADNHLILFTVDGRRAGIGEGMSARELTLFLKKWFNPQYALNMDGGGSTTLCVRGQGDPDTHVVNYPTDNKRKYDHAGERKLYTHFYIVEVPEQQPEPAFANKPVREQLLQDPLKASGLDNVYSMAPKASTPAPKGYEPVYVGHYGRHGSRYAYTSRAYTVPLEMLKAGKKADNLTPYGEKLLNQLTAFWVDGQYKVGDLTPLGWQQHQYIAKTMTESFPTAFGKGSRIDACSSASVRAIISMTSSVSAFSRYAPKADVYAHQGALDVQATRPNTGKNPLRYKGPDTFFPFTESSEEFFFRRFPNYMDVLGRLFKDPVAGLGQRDPYDVFFHLYMFVGGMNSIPEEERMDVGGIFTPEEFVTLWECDSYERYREYVHYRTSCSSIVDDIVAKADIRLADGSRGADLRFGHDHVVMSLLMIMDIDGFDYVPAKADDLVYTFQTFRSCMATNIQFVFYKPKKGNGDVLVKVLLNGEEARLGELETVTGPYYSWDAVKKYLAARTAKYVAR